MAQSNLFMAGNHILSGLRKKLISDLQDKGIKDQRILDAFDEIPRHKFIDEGFAAWAYKDVPFKIDADQTISQPYTVAFMTQLLEVKSSDKILEVGTGSGYQACVLAYLGAKVYTIERQESLFLKTNKLLVSMGFSLIRTLLGDGYEGAPRFAPFDKIIVTAGAREVPMKLFHQLKIGGFMVIPVGEGDTQEMLKLTKVNETDIVKESHGGFIFVPFLPGVNLKG